MSGESRACYSIQSTQSESGELNVRICRNLAVLGQNRTLKEAGGCDQQLIGRITMEGLRQLGRFHHDPGVEGQKRHAGSAKGAFYPKPDSAIKLQPAVLDKFRDFPARDDANPEDAIRAKFEKLAMPRLQPIRPRNPPDPNVGVEQNHCKASQSLSATGSVGSRYSRTEFRRAPSAAALAPAVFEITNTSTGSPGSKGRPSKRSSPWAPTAASLQCACTPLV